MFVSTILAERIVQVCEDSGATDDERLAALQIAMTLIMRGLRPTCQEASETARASVQIPPSDR
jgi:hypothetical protein